MPTIYPEDRLIHQWGILVELWKIGGGGIFKSEIVISLNWFRGKPRFSGLKDHIAYSGVHNSEFSELYGIFHLIFTCYATCLKLIVKFFRTYHSFLVKSKVYGNLLLLITSQIYEPHLYFPSIYIYVFWTISLSPLQWLTSSQSHTPPLAKRKPRPPSPMQPKLRRPKWNIPRESGA